MTEKERLGSLFKQLRKDAEAEGQMKLNTQLAAKVHSACKSCSFYFIDDDESFPQCSICNGECSQYITSSKVNCRYFRSVVLEDYPDLKNAIKLYNNMDSRVSKKICSQCGESYIASSPKSRMCDKCRTKNRAKTYQAYNTTRN